METSVEWLAKRLYEEIEMNGDGRIIDNLLEQASLIHKQEIIDAFDEGQEYEYQYHINNAPKFDSETYYQETFVSKGSDDTFKVWECCGMEECICKHPSVISENGNELLFDKEGNLIKELPQQETLYTEEQTLEFAKWLAANWFPMWVKDKFVWEHDWDKTCEEQKYQGYYNEKQLFELFISLKQPKKD